MYNYDLKTRTRGLLSLCFLAFGAFLIMNSREASQKTYEGILFSARYIISSIFPFVFLSGLLRDTSFLENISKSLSPIMLKMKLNPYILPPFLISIFCGFPIGAAYISELNRKNLLSKKEADILLPMCNNPSPAFVVSTVGAGFLQSQKTGVILWFINILFSCILTLFLLPRFKGGNEFSSVSHEDYSFSVSFVSNVKKSAKSALNVGSTVTLFYLISATVKDIFKKNNIHDAVTALSVSFLEIGNGCMLASGITGYATVLCAFAVGFSGLSVFFQVKASAHENSNMSYYMLIKIICGLLSALFALFLL